MLITHITEIVKSHGHELLGRKELKALLDNVKESYPNLVEELVPNALPMGTVHKVCSNLLKEHVSIRDMIRILETLSDQSSMTKDPDILTEYVRNSIARTICKPLVGSDGVLRVFTLDPAIEETITDAISDDQSHINLNLATTQGIVNSIAQSINNSLFDTQPIVLCSSLIRRHFKKLTERFMPNLIVIAYNEVPSNIEVEQIDTIKYSLNKG